jgi:hypothetical protein
VWCSSAKRCSGNEKWRARREGVSEGEWREEPPVDPV